MDKDYLLSEAGDNLVIVFSSYGIDGAPGTTAFATPRYEFMKSMSGLSLSCLFVMDRHQHWYHSGVHGLAQDIPSLASELKAYKHRYKNVLTLGHSMGGYAALLFAALCDFDAAIATAPQISILKDHRVEWGDHRWAVKVPETREISTTPEYFDIKSALVANSNPNLSAFYSAGDATDRLHSRYIEDLPNVAVTEIATNDHNTAAAIRDAGILHERLHKFAALE